MEPGNASTGGYVSDGRRDPPSQAGVTSRHREPDEVRGGILISLQPLAAEVAAEAAQRGIRAQVMLAEAGRSGMTAIAGLVTRGKLRPVIAGKFALANAADAHALGDRARGRQTSPHHALTSRRAHAVSRVTPER